MKERELLEILNSASYEEMIRLVEAAKVDIKEDVVRGIVHYRSKLEKQQFNTVEELSHVEGLDKEQLNNLLKAIELASKPAFTKSNTRIEFLGEPRAIEHLEGQYQLKKVQSFQAGEEETPTLNRYDLYYDQTKTDKETLLQSLQTQGGFVKSQLGGLVPYALQAKDNKFLSVNSAGMVTFSDRLTDDEIFLFDFGVHVPGWPYSQRPSGGANAHIYQPNGSGPFTMNKLNGNSLYYDYSNNKLSYDSTGTLVNSNLPNLPFGFEAFFLSDSFSMINYYSHNIQTGSDPRQFIAQEGVEARGSNQTEWFPKNFYRPIRVIKNISLKNKHFSNGTQQALVSTDVNGYVRSLSVALNSTIPDEAKFDMFVFYGWDWALWQNDDYTPRVVFRSAENGCYLSVDNNGYLNCKSQTISHNEYFALESMWGNTNAHTAIKTHLGKYLHTYNGTVTPNAINKVIFEAYQILEP